MPSDLYDFLFGIYPYICLAVLFAGCLVRFDREPYSWRSDSSQTLRKRELRLGSNMFHYGVIIVLLGHLVGFLLPEWLVMAIMSPTQHELLAMCVGGPCGLLAITGLTVLIHRRFSYRRVRANSRKWDIAIVLMLWAQLALGLATIWFSAHHCAARSSANSWSTCNPSSTSTAIPKCTCMASRGCTRRISCSALPFPGVALHSHGPHLEWRGIPRLLVPTLSVGT